MAKVIPPTRFKPAPPVTPTAAFPAAQSHAEALQPGQSAGMVQRGDPLLQAGGGGNTGAAPPNLANIKAGDVNPNVHPAVRDLILTGAAQPHEVREGSKFNNRIFASAVVPTGSEHPSMSGVTKRGNPLGPDLAPPGTFHNIEQEGAPQAMGFRWAPKADRIAAAAKSAEHARHVPPCGTPIIAVKSFRLTLPTGQVCIVKQGDFIDDQGAIYLCYLQRRPIRAATEEEVKLIYGNPMDEIWDEEEEEDGSLIEQGGIDGVIRETATASGARGADDPGSTAGEVGNDNDDPVNDVTIIAAATSPIPFNPSDLPDDLPADPDNPPSSVEVQPAK